MTADNQGGRWDDDGAGSTDLARGATVGRYLIIGLLGKGGMGEVYAAYDPELDRKVALKLLRTQTSAGIDASEGRARMLREAQAIARLSDPNVVVVFDVGTYDNRVFLAMEFVDGTTLGYWTHAQTRTWREIVSTFVAAGRGLASAHRAGIVHRDFKPDNVMIGRDGKVRVMDFGLARTIDTDASAKRPADPARVSAASAAAAGASIDTTAGAALGPSRTTSRVSRGAAVAAVVSSAQGVGLARQNPARALGVAPVQAIQIDESRSSPTRDLSAIAFEPIADGANLSLRSPLTDSGAMLGTPAYMAPEQFSAGAIDARTDQFSFCLTLYEALYGQRPFAGRSIADLSANMKQGRVREAPLTARVPGWVRKVVLKGLRAEITERHDSMDTLLALLTRDPAVARRRWLAAAAVAGLIVSLGAGLVRAERRQRLVCVGADAKLAGIWELPTGAELSPRKATIRASFLATGKRYAEASFLQVQKMLDRYVTDWNDMHRDACEATNMRGEQSAEVLDLRMTCLHERLSEVRALTGVFSDANGDVVSKSVAAVGSLHPVEQCADIAALRAVVRPPDDPNVRAKVADVRTQLAGARALRIAGKYKQVSSELPAIVDRARQTHYPPIVAEALLELGVIDLQNGESSLAETTLEEAAWTAESARHDEVLVEAVTDLIYTSGYSLGRFADGLRWGQYAKAILTRLGSGHDVIAGWRANNLGVVYEKQGLGAESLAVNLEAVALKTRALGATHFDVGISLCNVALAQFRLGHLDEAIEVNERAYKILSDALGPDHPQVAISLVNGAELLNARGRYEAALKKASLAAAIWERESGPDHQFMAYAYTAMGQSLVGSRRAAQAIPYLEHALRIRETKDPDPELLAETEFALARGLWDGNRNSEKAMALAKHARSNFEGQRTPEKRAEVDRWIESHGGSRAERELVRPRSGRTQVGGQRARITHAL